MAWIGRDGMGDGREKARKGIHIVRYARLG
jgi:hypothetical protein